MIENQGESKSEHNVGYQRSALDDYLLFNIVPLILLQYNLWNTSGSTFGVMISATVGMSNQIIGRFKTAK